MSTNGTPENVETNELPDQEPQATDAQENSVEEAQQEGAEATESRDWEAELEAANNKANENWDRALRIQAEMDNLRKRAQRDVENAHKFALEKIANELLAVRDSLEMGHAAAQADDVQIEKLREGSELTLRMLTQAMEKFSIIEVNPLNEKFDPDLHQAMTMQPAEEGVAPNTVTMVMQKGYTLNGRLIRPALVMVAK